jgi:hypothetical protein
MIYQKPVMLPIPTKEYLDLLVDEINDNRLKANKGLKKITRGDLINDALNRYNVKNGMKI